MSELNDFKTKMKRELRFGMIVAPIVISLILGTANVIAQKIFYTNEIEDIKKRATVLEKRANEDERLRFVIIGVLQNIDINVQDLCRINKIDYKRIPKYE